MRYRGQTIGITSGGRIGSFGNIYFEVSNNRIETISNYKRDISAKYTEHEVIGGKPVVEYQHAELQKIQFTMQLGLFNKVNPFKELEKLETMCEKGAVNYLLIGNTVIGDHKWLIESVKETSNVFDNAGNLIYVEAEVSLIEYV